MEKQHLILEFCEQALVNYAREFENPDYLNKIIFFKFRLPKDIM